MSLGTGIFLSSLFLGLILLYWITKDRWQWSRMLLWLVGGLAVIGGALYLYSRYEATPTKQVAYDDLSLGMSQDEVLYVKGSPTNVLEEQAALPVGFMKVTPVSTLDKGHTVSDFLDWQYQTSDYVKTTLSVSFDAARKVAWISCRGLSCPTIFGLQILSSEEEVIRKLGKPTSDVITGTTKRLEYKPYNVTFSLTKKVVSGIRVGER